MKTNIERGEQGESSGDQSPPTEGAAGRAAVKPSSELSDVVGVAPRREGGVKLGSTAAAEAPRWEYNRWHPRRAWRKGDYKSHGVVVCTPGQQQRQHQHQLQQVGEKADMGLSPSEGKRVCIRASREDAQSPSCAQPAVRIGWESRAIYHDRVHSAAGSIVAEGAGPWISGDDCSSTTTRGKTSAWRQVERHNNRTRYTTAAAAAAAAAGRSWRGQTWV